MITASISELKANLSYYVNLATTKNEIISICNHNLPVAELRPVGINKPKRKIKFGVCKDKIILPRNFNNTSKDIIDSFYTKDQYL